MIPVTFSNRKDRKKKKRNGKPVHDPSYLNIPGWFNCPTSLHTIICKIPDNDFVYVEVGTFMGRSLTYFTDTAIKYSKKGKIYGIDTFDGSPEHRDKNNISYIPELESNPNYLYEQYLRYTKPIKEHIETIRGQSIEVSQQFEDNSIDALYLDAAHDYDNVLKDLNAWYPKMKKEQLLLLGDDWKWEGVRTAAIEFTRDNGLCLLFPQDNHYIITNFEFLQNYGL